jgi:hypothetical protein
VTSSFEQAVGGRSAAVGDSAGAEAQVSARGLRGQGYFSFPGQSFSF